MRIIRQIVFHNFHVPVDKFENTGKRFNMSPSQNRAAIKVYSKRLGGPDFWDSLGG